MSRTVKCKISPIFVALLTLSCLLLTAGGARAIRGDEPVTVEVELSTKNVRTEESNLATVILNALMSVEKTDAAMMHASAFAEISVAKGKSTAEDILKAVAYREDNIVIVKLTGAQIIKALENGLKLHPQRSPEFLQVAGMTVSVDASAERDKRVIEVKIGSQKIDDGKKYTVAMPAPLANGALGYYKIWDKTKDLDHETSKTVGQAVTEYLTKHKTLTGKLEERIVFKK